MNRRDDRAKAEPPVQDALVQPPPDVATATASAPVVSSPLRRGLGATLRFPEVWIFLVLMVEIVLFSLVLPEGTFLNTFNIKNIGADSAVVLLLATASTLVILTGGIDLSLGSVLTLSAVVAARVMSGIAGTGGPGAVEEHATLAIIVGACAGVGVGAAWGLLNGLLVAVLRLPPFVVTLGSFGTALGAARLISGGGTESGGAPPDQLQGNFGQADVFGVPIPFLLAAALMLLFGLMLAKSRYGEHTYMIGSNEEAARRGGINVTRHLTILYMLAGMLAGVAGVVDLARFDIASIATGHVTELIAAIAAVVIGGASLFGGRGKMIGTAIGVYIPVILANGLLIGGIPRFWQDVIIGIILVTAVAFDQWRRERELKSQTNVPDLEVATNHEREARDEPRPT